MSDYGMREPSALIQTINCLLGFVFHIWPLYHDWVVVTILFISTLWTKFYTLFDAPIEWPSRLYAIAKILVRIWSTLYVKLFCFQTTQKTVRPIWKCLSASTCSNIVLFRMKINLVNATSALPYCLHLVSCLEFWLSPMFPSVFLNVSALYWNDPLSHLNIRYHSGLFMRTMLSMLARSSQTVWG